MSIARILGAAIVSVAMFPASYVAAAPLGAAPESGGGLVINVQRDCHSDVRTHRINGRQVTHRHRANCRVVIVEEEEEAPRDCHSDVRTHRIDGRQVTHRHRANCRIVVVDDEDESPRDCHREARRHFLPEFGRSVVHRHTGDSCRVRVLEERNNGGSNCVQIGPIRYCEG